MGLGYGIGGFAQGLTSGLKTAQGIMAFQDNRDRRDRLDKERADDRTYNRGINTRNFEAQQSNRAEDVTYRQQTADRTEQYRQDTLTSSENAAAIAADHWEKTFEAQSELRKMQMGGQKTLNSLNRLKLNFEKESMPSRKKALQNEIKTNELAYKSANLKFEQQQDKVTASRLEVMSSFLADPKKLSGMNNADMGQMLSGLNAAYSDVINTNARPGEKKLITGGQLIEGNFHPEITVFDESGKQLRVAPWGENRLPEDQQSIGIPLPELKKQIDIKRALLGGPRGKIDWVKSKTKNADDQEVTVNVGWVKGKPAWRQDSDGNVTPYKAAAAKPTAQELLYAGKKKGGNTAAPDADAGRIVTDKTGQKWKMQNGKPVKVGGVKEAKPSPADEQDLAAIARNPNAYAAAGAVGSTMRIIANETGKMLSVPLPWWTAYMENIGKPDAVGPIGRGISAGLSGGR